MPNKTPYELRFDVLQMARDLEMENYQQFVYPFWQIHSRLENLLSELEEFKNPSLIKEITDLVIQLKNSIPQMPTTEQINQKARELYEFVEQK